MLFVFNITCVQGTVGNLEVVNNKHHWLKVVQLKHLKDLGKMIINFKIQVKYCSGPPKFVYVKLR